MTTIRPLQRRAAGVGIAIIDHEEEAAVLDFVLREYPTQLAVAEIELAFGGDDHQRDHGDVAQAIGRWSRPDCCAARPSRCYPPGPPCATAMLALAWSMLHAVSEVVARFREAAADDAAQRAEDQAERRTAREEILRKD